MLRISVMSGPQDGQEVVCVGPLLRVGRPPECDLCLAHDPDLPPEGVFLQCGDEVTIRDDSGQRAAAYGELFQVGLTWLRVALDDRPQPEPEKLEPEKLEPEKSESE